jgi:hypothetical protein
MSTSAYAHPLNDRPSQGSVYRDIKVALLLPSETVGMSDLDTIELAYAVVMTQECDLLQDQSNRKKLEEDTTGNHDKFLTSVLVCPAYPAELLRHGDHLVALERKMEPLKSRRYKQVKQNQETRYHYLSASRRPEVQELIVDFKHIVSVSIDLLRITYPEPEHHIARLTCPYREHLSQRFSAFLSRVGLPMDHHHLPAEPKQASPRL